jgi:hypothetical protein
MAIIMKLDVPGGTTDQYDRTNEILDVHGDSDAPAGLVSHVCGVTEDGILIVDVWDSEESLNRFYERLRPALREAGFPEARPQITKVHNMIPKGRGVDANVIMIVEVDAGPDVYDQLIGQMDAHVADGEQHPAVSHVAGAKEGGGMLIVDLWDSPESFGEFAQTEIAPAGGDRLGEINPRFVPVHNVIRGRATANA